MTKLALAFGSRDARFYSGNMRIASEVPHANVAGSLLTSFLAHYQLAPDLQTATYVHAAITMTAAVQVVTTGITQPDYPRIATIKGNASGNAGNVVIAGTNFAGDAITDTIALNGASEVLGVKAFRTIASITLPVQTHAGTDTTSIGVGKLFGLPHIVYNASCLLLKLFNASADSGTLAVDADELEKNLFSLNGTPDGAKLLDLYYII
jgi:hypothetical protein